MRVRIYRSCTQSLPFGGEYAVTPTFNNVSTIFFLYHRGDSDTRSRWLALYKSVREYIK